MKLVDPSILIKFFFQNNEGIEGPVNEPQELEKRIVEFQRFISEDLNNFTIEPEIIDSAITEIRSRINVKFSFGATLSDGTLEPWVDECWNTNSQYYWKRYRDYLSDKDWSAKVIRDIDQVTNNVLDQCGNPMRCELPWQRRGLVIGDVQSGKTAVFTGLINKAADAGYRVIIVLTGVLESLRKQTQGRLDEEFVGRTSRNDKKQPGDNRNKIGVGHKASERSPMSLTSVSEDFNKRAIGRLNFSISTVHEPVLLVLKKNVSVLQSVRKWLERKNLDGQYVNFPLFLIDDEADNASVNTNKDDENPTKVNNEIRDLLALFKNATYVGFTATPFANVFINPDETDGISDDLFPRNFIRTTNIPSNYFGVQKMLGDTEFDEEVSYGASPYLCLIDDAEKHLPLKHKKIFLLTVYGRV